MHIKSKRTVIGEALDDWTARGLLDGTTTARLRADLDSARSGFSFNAFIITAGVICLGFAAMTFVAANWEEMSRFARLALIGLALWGAWGAALWTGLRGLRWWHEGLMLLACAFFGAAIMLVSQIYHIQGNAADAVWLWGLGTLVAAALTRGLMPLALAIGLFALWHVMQLDTYRSDDINLPYLGWWLAGAALAWGLRSRIAGHLSIMALCLWLFTAIMTAASEMTAGLALLAGSAATISLLLASMAGPRLLRGFEAEALPYPVLLLSVTSALLMLEQTEPGLLYYNAPLPGSGPWLALMLLPSLVLAVLGQIRGWALSYDLWITLAAGALLLAAFSLPPQPLLPEALLLALFVWITRMGWRLDLRSLRVIGMIGFVLALLTIYGRTVGTLIGTSGFYLGAGLILLAGAWVATRLDPKREGGK